MRNHRELAYALLRVTVGVMFLFYGVGKLMIGPGAFAAGLAERFSGSLPAALVLPFGWVLPFIEVTVGTLLILGLFSTVALIAAAVLMIGLTFGAVMEPNPPTVADNVNFALVLAALLFLSEHNGYSLDRRRRGSPGGAERG